MDKPEAGKKVGIIRHFKWPIIITAVFVVLVGLVYVSNILMVQAAQGKFLTGTKVSGVDIGGLSREEAQSKIEKQIEFMNQRGFVYTSSVKNVTVYPNVSAIENTDTSYPLVVWETSRTLDYITKRQSDQNLLYFWDKIETFSFGKNYRILYIWNRDQHRQILADNIEASLPTKNESTFSFEGDNLIILRENAGQTVDYEAALRDTEKQIAALSSQDIALQIILDQPTITKAMVESLRKNILSIVNRGFLYTTYEKNDWGINNQEWRNWLKVKQDGRKNYIGMDPEKLTSYYQQEGIAKEIEQPVQNARFKIEDGKVSEFLNGQAGVSIDMDETIRRIDQVINEPGELEIQIATMKVEPEITNDEVNNLGITELLGTGESDFTGSPPNRIHNIGVGAASLNGVLIAPGEEFSLLKALGEIDAASGYLPELVIKGDRTIPEYGGGLCQIGTTTFRATLASGLEVTQRRNHSYRVVYYEPAGTDATIYDPWPDYRFKNDTGHHVLIQTRIEGYKLYFDFWGTSDGRQVSMTEPTIYNIVAPPTTKIIKTTDLEPGQKKCTERAHNGADAKFDYTVKYPSETEARKVTFYSHYVPWQEVCLLGVTPEELAAEQASSTPEGTETTPLNP